MITMDSAVPLQRVSEARRVPNALLGTIIFVAAEIMFFAALISANTIARANAPGGVWPPPGQPRLPFERTAMNTAALLLSGVLLWLGHRFTEKDPDVANRCVAGSLVLGGAFLLLQGVEWVRLIREGLTLTSSSHGGFFYLIVGAHGLHVVGAILVLAWAYYRMLRKTLSPEAFAAVRFFWYFVVLLWPVLYLRVYL